ncbi:MAG: hypothetical protein IANPNBLG_00543 [Bryobacteraceae bacterium]|nr:hypothetical protein [Bryobacteraceae bacterium]
MRGTTSNKGSRITRRNYCKAKLSSLLALNLSGAAAQTSQPATLPRATWIKNGIIDAGGSHEPYTFVVRRGGQRLDAYQRYQHAQSEEVIRRLKEQGVEVFHTHFYKGAGMAHERREMEDTKRAAAIAHRYGLKVDTYLQWNTMIYEPFFAEEPRARNWIQRDVHGRPVMLTYGFQQSFRYRPCFANQEYLDYLKKIVRFAVEEVRTDFIHFDNFDLNAEPDSCHCQVCVRRFREFLTAKYTPTRRQERFGFENIDYVNPPEWNAQNRPEDLQIIFDPAIQEWIDFRCQIMAGALQQMAVFVKSINPEVVIEVNPHGITGGNRAWEAGLDHARFLKFTEVFWTEERNLPDLLADGRLVSTIRSYKLARAFDNVLFTYTADHDISTAECLAFNQTIGYAGSDPLSPSMKKYIAFYREHRDLYIGAKDAAAVALLRSYPSITYNNAVAQLSAVLAEQTLIQAHIPFDLIFDEHVAGLSKYRAVVLPDSECLSGAQVDSIRRYVEDGGGLVVIGRSGLYDEWRRLRVQPGLAGLVDLQPRATGYEERVQRSAAAGRTARKEFGKGRVSYIPALIFDGDMPERTRYYKIGPQFWKRPANWADLAEAVRWVSRGGLTVEINGPEYLVVNVVTQPEKRRMLVHLLNYNARKGQAIKAAQVRCKLPEGVEAADVKLYSPDMGSPVPVKVSGSAFTVPEVKVYTIAVVSW